MATTLSIRDFICKGEFGGVRPGMTRDEICQHMGEPDDWMMAKQEGANISGIWRYGTFEIHFEEETPEAIAWMLFTDYLDPLDVGDRPLDLWIFGDDLERSFEAMADRLTKEKVPFAIRTRNRISESAFIEIDNGAILSFDDESNLSSISVMNDSEQRVAS